MDASTIEAEAPTPRSAVDRFKQQVAMIRDMRATAARVTADARLLPQEPVEFVHGERAPSPSATLV